MNGKNESYDNHWVNVCFESYIKNAKDFLYAILARNLQSFQ